MKTIHNFLGFVYYTLAALIFGYVVSKLLVLINNVFGTTTLSLAIIALAAAFLWVLSGNKPDESGPLDFFDEDLEDSK